MQSIEQVGGQIFWARTTRIGLEASRSGPGRQVGQLLGREAEVGADAMHVGLERNRDQQRRALLLLDQVGERPPREAWHDSRRFRREHYLGVGVRPHLN